MNDSQFQCPQCGAPCGVSISQRVMDQRLGWSAAFVCHLHGHQTEMDGIGLPPVDLRQKIISTGGVYELIITGSTNHANALRSLQKALGLTIRGIAQLKKRLPAAVLSGTEYEMNWLAKSLARDGVSARVEQRSQTTQVAADDIAEIISAPPGPPSG